MRFARSLEHLRQQNWAAVAIEFVIVVAGVFLGLQVNNWNQTRVENERAHTYLVRIHSDLAAEAAAIDRRTRFVGQALGYARGALAYAEDGALVDGSAWKTVLAFYQASQLYPAISIDSTYREMTSVGDLRLIRDQHLSANLSAYYANNSTNGGLPTLFAQIPPYRETIRGLTPFAVQNYIWANCHSVLLNNDQQMIDCASPITDAQARAILGDVMADPQAVKQLRFWASQMTVENAVSAGQRADVVQLATEVATQTN
jgi:hypothetical protein